MRSKTAYLDAADRTQDLLNMKWTLRSVGYSIGSTWHDADAITPAFKGHWNANGIEELQCCDVLVVLCGTGGQARPELAMMSGFALARNIRVIWIGTPLAGLSDFRAVSLFDSPERFQNELLSTLRSESVWTCKRLAA
jgi:hypothetical protein